MSDVLRKLSTLYYTAIFLYKNINYILVCPCGFYFVIIKHSFSVYERQFIRICGKAKE